MAGPMGYLFGRCVLIFAMSVFLAAPPSAIAGNPIGDFFKRLGNSIAHPSSSPAPRKTPPKRSTGKKPNEPAPSPGMSPGAPPAPPVPTPTPPPALRTPMPVPPVVRSAAVVPPAKRSRRDLPYGIPVPEQAGICHESVRAQGRLRRCPRFSRRDGSERSLHRQGIPDSIADAKQGDAHRS